MRVTCIAFCSLALGLAVIGPCRADDKADVKAILDKVIAAHGGLDKLKQIQSVHIKFNTTYPDGGTGDIDVVLQPPDRMRYVREEKGDKPIKEIRVLDGDKGWIQVDGKTEEANAEQLEELQSRNHRYRMMAFFRTFTEPDLDLSPLPEAKVGDHAAVGFVVHAKGQADLSFSFDKETGHLLKVAGMVHRLKDGKEVPQEMYCSGYKDVGGGFMRPTKFKIVRSGKPGRDEEAVEYKISMDKQAADTFTKP